MATRLAALVVGAACAASSLPTTRGATDVPTGTDGTAALVALLRGDMLRSPCSVHANFYPSGQWRLARGFQVDAGNTLPSSHTHYQPRVFVDCGGGGDADADDEGSGRASALGGAAPGQQTTASVVLFSLPEAWVGTRGDGSGAAGDGDDYLGAGWLHWLVADVPLDCAAAGGCHAAVANVPGKALHTHRGRTVAAFVPPGVAELGEQQPPPPQQQGRPVGEPTTAAATAAAARGGRVYVVALYAAGARELVDGRSLETAAGAGAGEGRAVGAGAAGEASGLVVGTSSATADLRAHLLGRRREHGGGGGGAGGGGGGDGGGGGPRLLGLNFFRGVVDSMGQMQFHDVKEATHGIVHSSTLAAREETKKDEL